MFRMKIASKNGSIFTYHSNVLGEVQVQEDSKQVDGIGGVLWDGSLLMNIYLEQLLASFVPESPMQLNIVELGSGAGLTSILISLLQNVISSNLHINITATDRFVDLASLNCHKHPNVCVSALDWTDDASVSELLKKNHGKVDLIIGSEILVLIKQQHHLVSTIKGLSNTNTLILATSDGVEPCSNYERQFLTLMRDIGFAANIVCKGAIKWSSTTEAMLEHCAFAASPNLKAPLACFLGPIFGFDESDESSLEAHHVTMFYASSSARTCKHCHKQFLPLLSALCSPSCVHHPQLFVNRQHPSEIRMNCGYGDEEGYYGGGTETFEAKFWDCCGNSDKTCIGCAKRRCSSYDGPSL